MPFIIGTAGHIDHGKTSLVKALTGEDTDRLKEEKERGISIELGFAHLDLPDLTRAGVIDVPGHERFIRTMVAGSHGVDLVLFTVAADDGVMPQTIEHLEILHLLGVKRGIFVLTKVDLATPARASDVASEIARLAAGTSLDGSPVVPFSFVTGEGRGRLLAAIAEGLTHIDRRRPAGYFRVPVDRAFVLRGHGLVVTGTALQGEVRAGDRLRCLPGNELFRVRSVQVHGEPVDRATWGQRIAINLAGHERPTIERGHVLCDERLTMMSDRFDALVEVRPTAPVPVRNHQRVRVHMGTAERLGKLVILATSHGNAEIPGPAEYGSIPPRLRGPDQIAPGQSAFCQVAIGEPLLALRGDRFIVRDETAQRTLGGGIVLNPWPDTHRRGDPGLDARLRALCTDDYGALAEQFLDERPEFATEAAPLWHFLNLRLEDALEHAARRTAIRVVSPEEQLFTTERKWALLKAALVDGLRDFHRAHPLEAGGDMEALREKLRAPVSPRAFRAFVAQLEAERVVMRQGNLLRLPEHRVALRSDDQAAVDRIHDLLARSPLAPPDLRQIAADTGLDRARLAQLMRVLERDRLVVRAGGDLYFLRESIDSVVRGVREQFSETDEITPAMFRDRFNTTRKYAIPLLEYLDREGVTVRIGDTRRLRQWSKSPAASERSSSG
ncbi:MAG: selenocysteine-specific translation elongation factor [Acidobacteria bacterium RIFCSPLOWO2_02_FULL_68_18]|nr:MAG: selenocysteine-specific translation elongation factor [Acidobacteria bacterium RIFCSPLOWO2_02_FULL_68_18]OFW51214.1 MAG: selenocysteine-specific translation elongation factor [Acidobacteria bacterium RIFCSPLOWO2_12_FULL_68_19]